MSRRTRSLLALVVAVVLTGASRPSVAADKVSQLPAEYQQWLADVEPLITKRERKQFLELEKDYQRDAFIERFWKARDPRPATEENEFKGKYYARLEEVGERYGGLRDDRARIFLLHGDPSYLRETDCGVLTWPLEIWHYSYSTLLPRRFTVIFVQPSGGGPFRIWRPIDGYENLFAIANPRGPEEAYRLLYDRCGEMWDTVTEIVMSFREVEYEGRMGAVDAERAPPPEDPEWLQSFRAFSTDLPAEGEPLTGEVSFAFPGTHQQRTIVQGRIVVPVAEAGVAELVDSASYNFLVTGEVLRGEELFESFRYQFDLPRELSGTHELPLIFERALRPGTYAVVVKVEDLNSGRFLRDERQVEVPGSKAIAAAFEGDVESSTEPVAGPAALELVADVADLRAGLSRFTATASGEAIRKVAFLLDGKPVLTKTRPPYSVELDLGELPTTHSVRVVGYDDAGSEVATDELLVNPARHLFQVRVIEPRSGASVSGTFPLRAEVAAPDGAFVDRVELYVGDDRVATVYQPPYAQSVPAPAGGSAFFVRAVAFLEDGNATEDLVLLNAEFAEAVDVRLVELYVGVNDADRLPVLDLDQEAFTVRENGALQEIVRFERLRNLPLYAGLLIDTSASMEDQLEDVRIAARDFFEQAVKPSDRATLITFSDRPRIAADFTSDLTVLGGALAGLRAERSTALYDSLIFGLHYFQGLKGQKALIVLSDGKDRRSEYTFEQTLEFAQRAGVVVYAIGLKGGKGGGGRLARLAAETGGRSFQVDSAAELGPVYRRIERDLRSRYLLVYQPSATGDAGFRAVTVEVGRPGLEVEAPSGYYP